MKPRIQWNPLYECYQCVGLGIQGMGLTLRTSYVAWLKVARRMGYAV